MNQSLIIALPAMRKTYKSWDRDAVMSYVCEQVSSTSLSVEKILEFAPWDMPNKRTIFAWLAESDTYDHQYARAREAQMELLAEEIIDIADNQVGKPVMIGGAPLIVGDRAVYDVNSSSVAHAKVRIEARMWLMCKLSPKRYGNGRKEGVKDDDKSLSIQELLARALDKESVKKH